MNASLTAVEKRRLLARLISERKNAGSSPEPLSEGQRALWFVQRVAPNNTSLNLGEAVRIRGPLDRKALKSAVRKLTRRHPALQTVVQEFNGEPLQQYRPDLRIELEELDTAGMDEKELPVALSKYVDQPFSLSTEPPFRIALFTVNPREQVLALALHHIVGEFWALVILMSELVALYQGEQDGTPSLLPEPGASYTDFIREEAAFLASPQAEEQWKYWERKLSNPVPRLEFARIEPSHDELHQAETLRAFQIDAELSEQVAAFSRQFGVTKYVTLLSGFAALLYRFSGQEELRIGAPMTGRSQARFAGVVGFFDNALPLTFQFGREMTSAQLIEQVRQDVLGAFENQRYPLPRIVQRLRSARDQQIPGLFNTMFVLRQSPDPRWRKLTAFGMGGSDVSMEVSPGLVIEPAQLHRKSAQYDLALSLAEADGRLYASWEYNTTRVDAATLSALTEGYVAILNGLMREPHAPVVRLPIVSDQHREQAFFGWNDTYCTFQKGDRLLHELFEETAEERPDALALISDRMWLTYRELDRRASAIAEWLSAQGAGPNRHVAVVMEKGWEQVAAVLGILKSGAAYLPVDAHLPVERIALLLQQGEVSLVLTQRAVEERLLWLQDHTRLCVDECAPSATPTRTARRQHGENLAYTIFTSGSTGMPKGVMLDHRGPVNTILDVNARIGLQPEDRVLGLSSLSFDLSVYDIFGTFAAGAALVIPAASGTQDPGHWLDVVHEHRVTVWNSVPSLLKLAVEQAHADGRRPLSSLRVAMLSGDWIPLDLPHDFRGCAPESRLISMGGATEASIWSIWYEIEDLPWWWRSIPYGQAMANQSFYVLDESLEPCPPGVVGYLYIGGIGLTRGYWRDDKKTQAALIFHPGLQSRIYLTGDLGRYFPDGNIEFLGRADFQLKIRGFRVEAGEIEAAIMKVAGIASCLVIATGAAGDDRRLAGYYTVKPGEVVRATDLRLQLSSRLPDYMVPSSLTQLEKFPLSANGKIDRKALPLPEQPAVSTEFAEPRSDVELRLAAIWAELLGVCRTGLADDFFDLGGDSITAIRIAARARAEGIAISTRDLFQYPLLGQLAAVAAKRAPENRADCLGPMALTPVQHALLTQGAREHMVVLRASHTIDPVAIEAAARAVTCSHDALRLKVALNQGCWLQEFGAATAGYLSADPLDLAAGRVISAEVAGENGDQLILRFHTVAADIASLRFVIDELLSAYALIRRGGRPHTSSSSPSFASWLARVPLVSRAPESREREHVMEYYSRQLSGPRVRDLVAGIPRVSRMSAVELLAVAALLITRETCLPILVRARDRGTPPIVGELLQQWRIEPMRGTLSGLYDLSCHVRLALRSAPWTSALDGALILEYEEEDITRSVEATGDWHVSALQHEVCWPAESVTLRVRRSGDEIHIQAVAGSSAEAAGLADAFIAALDRIIENADSLPRTARTEDFAHVILPDEDIHALQERHPDLEDVLPLAPMQQTMLLHALVERDPAIYCEHLLFDLKGQVDAQKLERSLNAVIARHPALRAKFDWMAPGQALQVIAHDAHVRINVQNVSGATGDEATSTIERIIQRDRETGFDLSRAPLLRLILLRQSPEKSTAILTHHHLIFDGWSVTVFLREWLTAYDDVGGPEQSNPFVARSFETYLAWLKSRDSAAAKRFWVAELQGFHERTSLAIADRVNPEPNSAFAHREAELIFPEQDMRNLEKYARNHKVTPASILIASWGIVLSRYASTDDLVFGVTGAGRPEEVEGIGDSIGLFINTIPMRLTVHEGRSVSEYVRSVQTRYAAIRDYQYVPTGELERWIGWDDHTGGLYESVLIFENYPEDERLLTPSTRVAITDVRFTEQTNTPLALYVIPGKTLRLRITYDGRRFDDDTAARILCHLKAAMIGISSAERVADIDITSEAEKRTILNAFNATTRDYGDPRPLQHMIEAAAARTPDAIAVEFCDMAMTYRDFDRRTGQLARELNRRGAQQGQRVAIFIERSIEALVAIFAILKSGAAYVPVDPEIPRERLAFVLADAGVTQVLTQTTLLPVLDGLGVDSIALDTVDWSLLARDYDPWSIRTEADAIACILYTSGSTGKPKGVVIEHRSIWNYAHAAADMYGITPADRMLQFFSLAFDAAGEEIFSTFAAGATLVLRPSDMLSTTRHFLEVCAGLRVSIVSLPTAVWSALMAELADPDHKIPEKLRLMIIGGEKATSRRVREWFARVGDKIPLLNTYGPTEATIVATAARLDPASISEPVTIGRPVANVRAYVLDPAERLAPIGVPGELYIGGAGVARGYLNRHELTTDRFILNSSLDKGKLFRTGDRVRYRPDGSLEYLDRLDNQVKIRGYRVELGEIESSLREHDSVRDCIVTTYQKADEGGVLGLVAYVVVEPGATATVREIGESLSLTLPSYMVPSVIVQIPEIPLNERGKLDRAALPPIDSAFPVPTREAFVEPQTDRERRIASIWAALLGTERVGLHEDFFQLGGHSLLILQLLARVRASEGADVPMRAFLRHPTVAGMIAAMDAPGENMADLLNDAELGSEFTIEGLQPILAVPPRRVLLTGATGFLGAYLVSDLIHQGVEEIWCLVRAKDEQDARTRLESNLRQHGLWDDNLRAKVRPLAGDLAAPSLGLDVETFRQLGNILDAIVHSGALVNFVSGYDALKPVNVGGTREVLRLATQARIVPVHYISTLSVFPSDPKSPVALELPLDVQPANLKSGYSQSKWVAERLVEQAGSRGLPLWIYRPGRITGESRTGRWSTDDLICRIIRACVEIKAAPEMGAIVDMTPVDYVSGVIARSVAGGCAQGCYHLVNPQPAPVSRLTDGLRALGYRLEQVSVAEWTARLDLLVRDRTDHPYFGLSPLLNEWESTMRPSSSGATHYDSTKARLIFGPHGLNCPPADSTLIRTYVNWLIDEGALNRDGVSG